MNLCDKHLSEEDPVDIKAARAIAARLINECAGLGDLVRMTVKRGDVQRLTQAVLACCPPDLAAAVARLPDFSPKIGTTETPTKYLAPATLEPIIIALEVGLAEGDQLEHAEMRWSARDKYRATIADALERLRAGAHLPPATVTAPANIAAVAREVLRLDVEGEQPIGEYLAKVEHARTAAPLLATYVLAVQPVLVEWREALRALHTPSKNKKAEIAPVLLDEIARLRLPIVRNDVLIQRRDEARAAELRMRSALADAEDRATTLRDALDATSASLEEATAALIDVAGQRDEARRDAEYARKQAEINRAALTGKNDKDPT